MQGPNQTQSSFDPMAAMYLLAVDRVAPVKACLLMIDCLASFGWVGPMVRSVYPMAVFSESFTIVPSPGCSNAALNTQIPSAFVMRPV